MKDLKELRQLDIKAIREELKSSRRDLANHSMQVKLKREKNTSFLGKQRRYIAKLNSVLNEKIFLKRKENGNEEKK